MHESVSWPKTNLFCKFLLWLLVDNWLYNVQKGALVRVSSRVFSLVGGGKKLIILGGKFSPAPPLDETLLVLVTNANHVL